MTTPSNLNPSDLIGTSIGGCQLEKLLGQGGMGVVFLAHHIALDVPVAVKILLPHPIGSGPEAEERFLREARAAARCRHPNIVGVLNTGEERGLRFIVMEYVRGGSLRSVLDQQGALPVIEAVNITMQVLAALECAAEYHIVHRDVKPDNILIDEKGVIKLADLGLARIIGSDLSLTQSDRAVGSPLYIAPEQASNPRSADHRADIYSLGCVLYHLLSGQPPFGGATDIEVIVKHVTAPTPDVKLLRRELPDALCAAVSRMMAKSPDDRYQTPAEARRGLVPYASAQESAFLTEGNGRPTISFRRKKTRRKALYVAVGGSMVAALVVGAVVIRVMMGSESPVLTSRPTAVKVAMPLASTGKVTARIPPHSGPSRLAPRVKTPRRQLPATVDPMTYAILKGDLDGLSEMLNKGANPNRPDGSWSPLHEGMLRGSLAAVTMLLQKGASPNARDDRGDVALHYAIRMHRTDMAGALLDYGANPNALDRNGRSPLSLATEAGAEAIRQKLREKGAR